MSDGFGVQSNFKFGANQQHMLNVRGDDADEHNSQVATLINAPDYIGNITALGSLLDGASVVQSVPTPPQAQGGPGWQAPMASPQPVVAGAGLGQQNAPTCPHGTRVFRTGVGQRGPWSAYFCPAPKGDPSQCKPDFQR